MGWRTVGIGAAIATFLLVGALATGSLAGWTEFSALVGIPTGLVVAVLAIVGTYRGTRADAPDLLVRALTGLAGFGYTVLGLLLVRYAVAATRGLLAGATRLAAAGVLVGLAVAVLVRPEDVRPAGGTPSRS